MEAMVLLNEASYVKIKQIKTFKIVLSLEYIKSKAMGIEVIALSRYV